MKAEMKRVLKLFIQRAVNISRKTSIGKYIHNQILEMAMAQVVEVSHNGLMMRFAAPNALCHWRAETFSTKEPETLKWVDSIKEGSVFWDVGANIGLYSVYAAKRRHCSVWAFEPSVFNIELLARNLYINGLSEQVCILPFALSDILGANQLRMTTTEWGGALSTFGQNFGWDGELIRQVFDFKTL
ncbi:MAG: FkbM family methyltransferase, partial [Desulfobacula sp.]